MVLPEEQADYIREKVADGWTPDTIIGRGERTINCSVWYVNNFLDSFHV
ncbi:hypothetical protein [Staphylococcus aureus]|nr:hypothetical protein [Staphylococcus aureus]MCC5264698.1 hypothetical protein [Staphylococcus aureus]